MRLAVASIVLAALVAGCSGPATTSVSPTAPSTLHYELVMPSLAVGIYAFPHTGGRIVFEATGGGRLQGALYSASDVRLATLDVGNQTMSNQSTVQSFDDVAAGELVVVVSVAVGTVQVQSAGSPVHAFRALREVEERIVVAEGRQLGPEMPGTQAIDTQTGVALKAPPLGITAYLVGDATDVQLKVRGPGGLVYEGQGSSVSGVFLPGPFGNTAFVPLAGDFHAPNVLDGNMTVRATTTALDGAVFLTVTRYQRLAPLREEDLVAPVTTFRYGSLPVGPVRFHVADGATQVFLESQVNGTTVALFDDHDHRVATFVLGPAETLAYPVHAGDYVAVLLVGEATLGSDVAPSPFDLYPLETVLTTAPAKPASNDGRYRQASEVVHPGGVLYGVEAHAANSIFSFDPCGPTLVVVMQDGEVAARLQDGVLDNGARYLREGDVTIVHGDLADGVCEPDQLDLLGYVR